MPICVCVYMFLGWEKAAGSKLIQIKKMLWSTLPKIEKWLTARRYAQEGISQFL